MSYCLPPKLLLFLKNSRGSNYSTDENNTLDSLSCESGNQNRTPISLSDTFRQDLKFYEQGLDFYAYVTPFVILLGICGNSIILAIFLSKPMRKMSASFYLASLAFSDSAVLLTYVLIDWLQKGLFRWPGKVTINPIAFPVVCEGFLLLTYSFRFMSVWFIVVFTLERYIGVCHPLHRKGICTHRFAKCAIGCVIVTSFVTSLYKPIISETRTTQFGIKICAWKEEFETENFILDTIYALLITAIPFTILSTLNIIIMRKLFATRRRHRKMRYCADDSSSVVKLEFTCLLLLVSTCFIALNIPYFIVWCMRLKDQISGVLSAGNPTKTENLRGTLYICKTIFSFNYCINFILYSLTGANFRKRLRYLFCNTRSTAVQRTAGSKTLYSQITLTATAPSTSKHYITNKAFNDVLQTEL